MQDPGLWGASATAAQPVDASDGSTPGVRNTDHRAHLFADPGLNLNVTVAVWPPPTSPAAHGDAGSVPSACGSTGAASGSCGDSDHPARGRSWGPGAPVTLAGSLVHALAARQGITGDAVPADELVVGPLRDSHVQELLAGCGWEGEGDSGEGSPPSHAHAHAHAHGHGHGDPTQAALLACIEQQLVRVEEVAASTAGSPPLTGACRGGPGAEGACTTSTSLGHRRPILATHVHLGDVVRMCPPLSSNGEWARDGDGVARDR